MSSRGKSIHCGRRGRRQGRGQAAQRPVSCSTARARDWSSTAHKLQPIASSQHAYSIHTTRDCPTSTSLLAHSAHLWVPKLVAHEVEVGLTAQGLQQRRHRQVGTRCAPCNSSKTLPKPSQRVGRQQDGAVVAGAWMCNGADMLPQYTAHNSNSLAALYCTALHCAVLHCAALYCSPA